MKIQIDDMIEGYLSCALSCFVDNKGRLIDEGYGLENIIDEALYKAKLDCIGFFSKCVRMGLDINQIESGYNFGFDFWLTRNRYVEGYCSRGLGQLGEQLTDIAQTHFKECEMFVHFAQDMTLGIRELVK